MKKTAIIFVCLVSAMFGCAAQKAGIKPLEPQTLIVSCLGTHKTGVFGKSAAEIVAYDASSKRLVFSNAHENAVVFLDIADPTSPKEFKKVAFAGKINSVAAHEGLIAAALEAEEKSDPGSIVFLNSEGDYLSSVTAGAMPDMVTFTPYGKYLLCANEGEPTKDYGNDPEGSVSIVEIPENPADLTDSDVVNVSFEGVSLKDGVRVTGPGNTTQWQDLEPEYIAVDPQGKYAYVSCQENNAIAKIDIGKKKFIEVRGLGYKDHGKVQNALDASKKDGKIDIRPWPLKGMYMPDALAAYQAGGETYVLSANEGDGREYEGYEDEIKVRKLTLDPRAFPDAADLQKSENLGGTVVSAIDGGADGDGDHDALYSFGARSFSIWSETLQLVYDSGADFEKITASMNPVYFNTGDDEDVFDGRSPKRGPEPEGLAVGNIGGHTYAFVLLERIGGFMIYDVSNPKKPEFVDYMNTRVFGGDLAKGEGGDLSPEGAVFIPAGISPTGANILAVAYEVSGTVTLFGIEAQEQ